MGPILLLRGRVWARPARACAAMIAAASLAVVPATQAKKEHGPGRDARPGHSRSHKPQHRVESPAPPGRSHGTGGEKHVDRHGKQGHEGKGKSKRPKKPKHSKEPIAEPSTTVPPAPPVVPVPSRPTKSRPVQTSPVTTPGTKQRPGVVARRLRRRGGSPHSRSAPGAGGRVAGSPNGRTFAPLTSASLASDSAHTAGERGGSSSGGSPVPDRSGGQGDSPVSRTVRDIVKVVPSSVKAILAALGALSVLLGLGSLFSTLRARGLDRQRRELLQEVGLLQSALLPPVPRTLGALRTSVAYRPADGLGAGGDFYDAISLPDGKAVFILGDVSGHGRGALERTAFLRYTLRAYLEAGLEPRVALQVAGRVIDGHLGGDFATVLLAVHDPATGSLTYASAGHPAPIVVGPSAYEPVLAASSPPVGVGFRTGLRQTTVPLAPGSVACLYTDGVAEARTGRGLLGRGRLTDIVAGMGREVEAPELLDRVVEETRLVADDMAVCLLSPTAGVTAGGFRTELVELSAGELEGPLGRRFLEGCRVPKPEAQSALDDAGFLATRFDHVMLHVVFGNRLTVEALPANVESIEAAARRGVTSQAL